ncbi:hypothetical protein AV530_006674 [Patagioenas fasciata monilis]|uniref:Uncharacterized protein n=1 Tax=Patagioenas fasciata monilis TaxID=372326 RepID=A0A1V4KRP5_PATFA|nr:hypothetical protein AV530_006674 [Patagioenas fasciata monilis]
MGTTLPLGGSPVRPGSGNRKKKALDTRTCTEAAGQAPCFQFLQPSRSVLSIPQDEKEGAMQAGFPPFTGFRKQMQMQLKQDPGAAS